MIFKSTYGYLRLKVLVSTSMMAHHGIVQWNVCKRVAAPLALIHVNCPKFLRKQIHWLLSSSRPAAWPSWMSPISSRCHSQTWTSWCQWRRWTSTPSRSTPQGLWRPAKSWQYFLAAEGLVCVHVRDISLNVHSTFQHSEHVHLIVFNCICTCTG